jgi:thiamine-phosphate pyrophosphorylase
MSAVASTPSPSSPPQLRGLYGITPEDRALPLLLQQVEAALAGGMRLLQYRSKSSDARRRVSEAQALCRLCHAHDARLIINDDVALAIQVGADGAHLGRDDGDLSAARAALGPQRLLGASCYNELALARRALAAGADHVAFGAAFASRTKPDASQAPLTLYQSARASLQAPIIAIGGITPDNAAPLVAAGVDALAMVSGLFDAADIQLAASSISSLYSTT